MTVAHDGVPGHTTVIHQQPDGRWCAACTCGEFREPDWNEKANALVSAKAHREAAAAEIERRTK